MQALRIELDLQPNQLEASKKVTFYRGLAAFFFLAALLSFFFDPDWSRLPLLLLLLFIGYRIYISAPGKDYLGVMANAYLLIDAGKFVLQRSRFVLFNAAQVNTTIPWPQVIPFILYSVPFGRDRSFIPFLIYPIPFCRNS